MGKHHYAFLCSMLIVDTFEDFYVGIGAENRRFKPTNDTKLLLSMKLRFRERT